MTIKQQIQSELKKVVEEMGLSDIEPKVDYPADAKHGDYSSNIALIAAKKIGKSPMELGESIAQQLTINNSPARNAIASVAGGQLTIFEKVEVVKPGFINFWIANDTLISSLNSLDIDSEIKTDLSGKKIVVEFAHPNTHKAFHIGHLRNITTGESIVRLLEAAGAEVVRANYQGDVGMHIAKCIYGILQDSKFKDLHSQSSVQANSKLSLEQKVSLLGNAYSDGSKAFEEDEKAKKEILEINKKIYARDKTIWELYETTRQWSLDYFELVYKRLGTHYDRYYFESEVYETGKEIVIKGLEKGIFVKSDGAIIFPGSKYGLHDRVFITSEGNPTYEGKDMGLGPLQFEENKPSKIIHVVGPEQSGYFQVVFEALAQMFPKTRGKEYHLAYGWVKLKHGKMSSRSGNVVLGEWLIDEAKKEILHILAKNRSDYTTEEQNSIAEAVAVGAVKYSFLKVSTQQEIAFDLEESISFEGNSGPYIQYVYARTQSVISKRQIANSQWQKGDHKQLAISHKLVPEERELLRLLIKFDEVIQEAASRLAPNLVCNYLFELAQAFNLFYQKCPIIKSEGNIRDFRLALTTKTGEVIKMGLNVLGIQAPVKM